LSALAQRTHVFSRISPTDKLQIVRAFQAAGGVVAMTGDGINDSPALKAADIGVAMGHSGTDIARDVADIVLEDDDLHTMIEAIAQGRAIYSNVRKSIRYLLATNASEILAVLVATGAGVGQPFSAMQLLWINLISDIFPALALALEPAAPDVLESAPRDPSAPIIDATEFRRLGFEAAAMSAGALAAFGVGAWRYGAGPQARTMAFFSLVTSQLLHALSARSRRHSIFGGQRLAPNPHLRYALLASFAVQGLAIAFPPMRALLGVARIGAADIVITGIGGVLPFIINEATKPSVGWRLPRLPRRRHRSARENHG
jgi:Ca2+-transporting ATPase